MTKPNDLSSFFLILPFQCCTHTTTAAVYKREHKEFKLFPTTMTDTSHYTQLANYHLPKFEASITKKAKRRQSVAYGKCIL